MDTAIVKDVASSHILVIDDSVENLNFLSKLLGRRGCRVDQAQNGIQALELAAANPPDLILLDIQMPGMDGFEVCRRLKQDERLNYIPVIFLSGLNDLDAKMRAFRGGGVDFITKPFHLEEIMVRLQTHLRLVRAEQLEREIEVRKQAESEIRRLNEDLENRVRLRTAELLAVNDQLRKFHRAIEHSPTTVVITNRTGEIEYVNPKFTETTGYSPEQVLGKNPRVLNSNMQPKDFYRKLWATIESGGEWRGEFCNKKKSGELYWESAAISPIWNDQGLITHYVAVKSDITELKRTTEEMKIAKEAAEIANKAKSVFLAKMSHEIRTPLNAILGYTQILQGDAQLTNAQKKTLGIVSRSGEHLLALINDILEMSKIEAGQKMLRPKAFDIHALMRDIESMFHVRTNAKGISLEVHISENTPRFIIADEGKIRQVVINLLGNAVKFTDHGGMSVRMKTLEGTKSDLRLKIEVIDSGTGIPKHELSRIFNPFEQASAMSTPREGTGLGLSISREFVKLMGGELTVQSELGKGSAFAFVIPVAPIRSREIQPPTKDNRIQGLAPGQGPFRILVADDYDLNRQMLSGMLGRVGFQTKEASDGAEAVALFESWNPHLVLMDLEMPVMDGYTAMKTIRSSKTGRNTILIPVTACGFEENHLSAKEAGANDFIRKPFKENELIETIARHLKADCVYESSAATEPASAPKMCEDTGLEDAGRLAPGWITRMHEAMLNGDIFAVNELLGEIHGDFPRISDYLRKLADNYDYERIKLFLKR